LVELIQYPIKGAGIRALASFKAGAVLGEYLGEVVPNGRKCTDDIYALSQVGFQAMSSTGIPNPKPLATTTSAYLGNWTRFINHHCEANCVFVPVMVDDRVTTVVEATQDISIFDEITVNYGPQYWRQRFCYCGSKNCYCPAPKAR
jgi:SET domain-containing protein